eukprot:scaffold20302_cov185-Amphora_coffeaeformis.AAC.7
MLLGRWPKDARGTRKRMAQHCLSSDPSVLLTGRDDAVDEQSQVEDPMVSVLEMCEETRALKLPYKKNRWIKLALCRLASTVYIYAMRRAAFGGMTSVSL